MILGKIDYINLLPFYVFLKKQNIKFCIKKGTPSKINKLFLKRKVDAAMISSIFSFNQKCSDFGIVAKNEVLSVLLIPGEFQADTESDTSNVLAKALNLKGKVIIGDKALRVNNSNAIDLSKLWREKTGLPFVFARFCFQKEFRLYKQLSNRFLNTHIKIPQYILKKYAKRSNIDLKQIELYLKKITYKIGAKEKKALNLFKKFSKKVH